MNFIPILHTPILSPRNWDASGFRSRKISGDAYSPLYFHVRSLFFHMIGFSSHSMSRWQPGNGKWRQQIKTKGKKRRNGENVVDIARDVIRGLEMQQYPHYRLFLITSSPLVWGKKNLILNEVCTFASGGFCLFGIRANRQNVNRKMIHKSM